MTRRHGTIDRRGFLVAKPTALAVVCRRPARWGLEWTVAEDQFLIRRLRELELAGDADPLKGVALELERGRLAISARLCSLRTGIRFVQDTQPKKAR